ncbi:hypothetical protein [Rubritalea tangerina]|uniref:Uncharacterized protein n=1 Tax=Rubritalea tangerina TaxID=430798 RepID=A0ABW4ZCS5_9BACT
MMTTNEDLGARELSPALKLRVSEVRAAKNDWSGRRACCDSLYQDAHYSEAADLLWEAPSTPVQAEEMAWVLRVLSKGRPSDAVRVVQELTRRIGRDVDALIRYALAFHREGLPLLAARFYGQAMGVDVKNFDIGFEEESLWCDDYGELVDRWQELDYQPGPPELAPLKQFLGKATSFLEYTQRITAHVVPQSVDEKEPASEPIKTEMLEGGVDDEVFKRPKLLMPKIKPKEE